ncbi:uncharacterized protein LOC134831097 [Culicoides brevitarsis]|uniref:uncharacterized protein LOC134831097 n=1 Tax=Culicoides brevitarsis TaxID=469753 RepID=UPI00307B8F6C
MKCLLIFLGIIAGVACNGLSTTRPGPPPPSDIDLTTLATGTGSYFEYAVRNVINNQFYFPFIPNDASISENEQMVYYYHLQMMHIDLMWIQNWQRAHPNEMPSLFDLPSRKVQYFYNYDVPYVFADGRQRTLQSHRLVCEECNRQFHCNVHNLHNHRPHMKVPEGFPGENSLPQMVSTNDAPSTSQMGQQSFVCEAPPVRYQLPRTTTEAASTVDLESELRRFHYDLGDELKKRLFGKVERKNKKVADAA